MADEQPAEAHEFRVYSTKPGHKLLRAQNCTCEIGKNHSTYENPGDGE